MMEDLGYDKLTTEVIVHVGFTPYHLPAKRVMFDEKMETLVREAVEEFYSVLDNLKMQEQSYKEMSEDASI